MESNPVLEKYLKNKPVNVAELSGGLVHQVYRIFGEDGTYIVKIRGKSASQLENVTTQPHEIEYEAEGIKIFSGIAPKNFPILLGEDIENGIIVLSDLLPSGGDTLQNMIFSSGITPGFAFKFGELIACVQSKLPVVDEFREDDKSFFEQILNFRFSRIPGFNHLQLLNKGNKGLIMGSLSPKNILIDTEGEIKICDLETVCVGIKEFDIGYALGHLLLTSDARREIFDEFFSGFETSFGLTFNKHLVNQYIAATILYRTYRTNVPYKINSSPDKIARLSARAMEYLLNEDESIDILLT